MKSTLAIATVLAALCMPHPADAKGCIKGALVGGAAGHYAGHHGLAGAGAGCVIGRHEANKRAREKTNSQPPAPAQNRI